MNGVTTPPQKTPPLAMVIFGASGDLTSRKILPRSPTSPITDG